MHVDTSDLLSGLAHGKNSLFDGPIENNRPSGQDEYAYVSDSPQIALATAQRVDMPAKIAASIR
jgi:hypothetical protein